MLPKKDHFSIPFINEMLKKLASKLFFYFLDEFYGYYQIVIAQEDQEKTTFTCPFRTFTYKYMPFRLCNTLSII
jgi:hypothetical protein